MQGVGSIYFERDGVSQNAGRSWSADKRAYTMTPSPALTAGVYTVKVAGDATNAPNRVLRLAISDISTISTAETRILTA